MISQFTVEVSVLLELTIPKLVPATRDAAGAETAPAVPAIVLCETKIMELAVTAVVLTVIAPAVIAAVVPTMPAAPVGRFKLVVTVNAPGTVNAAGSDKVVTPAAVVAVI